MLYLEPRKHGQNETISLMHHYLEVVEPAIGRVEKLIVFSDSCTGQNKNNAFIDFFFYELHMGITMKSSGILWLWGIQSFLPMLDLAVSKHK